MPRPKFTETFNNTVVSKIKNWLLAEPSDNKDHPNTSYCVVQGENTVVVVPRGACHAGLNVGLRPAPSLVVNRVWTEENRLGFSKSVILKWRRFINNSPMFKDYIYNPNVPHIYRHGLMVDTVMPGNLMLQMFQMHRHAHEYPKKIKIWNLLVKHGIEKHVAYACMWYFTANTNHFNKRSQFFWEQNCHAHMSLHPSYITIESIVAMRKGKPINPESPYKENTHCTGVFKLWFDAFKYKKTPPEYNSTPTSFQILKAKRVNHSGKTYIESWGEKTEHRFITFDDMLAAVREVQVLVEDAEAKEVIANG